MTKQKPQIGAYVRVSTRDKQTTASQRQVIRQWAKTHHVNANHLKWYEDKKSGKDTDRVKRQLSLCLSDNYSSSFLTANR